MFSTKHLLQISNKRLLICMDIKETKGKREFDFQEYYVSPIENKY